MHMIAGSRGENRVSDILRETTWHDSGL